ncbi:GNAT family N-acetyltransferase [Desertibaculum subflavum]|uniref:GNAT family N-acetyltransferase n=1 Tax=Desertibaculum subflavum TaxID=2268458 RepID=UPI000E664B1C
MSEVREAPRRAAANVTVETPLQAPVERLISMSDAYAQSLYPAESNHLVDFAALVQPHVRFFVARRDGQVVGCGALLLDESGREGELKRMFVDPLARGLKVGRELLQAMEAHARGIGVRVLRLETGIRQPAAIALYESAGFRRRPAFPPYRPDPLSLFMEKWLA